MIRRERATMLIIILPFIVGTKHYSKIYFFSMSHLPLICEVGFGSKRGEEEHFLKRWEMVFGYRIHVPTDPRYLDPYSMDELVGGEVPVRLLPPDLLGRVTEYASEVYEIMKQEAPKMHQKADKSKIRVRFYTIMENALEGH
jgi:hypothetical protein